MSSKKKTNSLSKANNENSMEEITLIDLNNFNTGKIFIL